MAAGGLPLEQGADGEGAGVRLQGQDRMPGAVTAEVSQHLPCLFRGSVDTGLYRHREGGHGRQLPPVVTAQATVSTILPPLCPSASSRWASAAWSRGKDRATRTGSFPASASSTRASRSGWSR